MSPAANLRPLHVQPDVGAAPATPAEARHAALLLHALAPDDRMWMLSQLAEPERATLVPLLAELEALGIPADRTFVEEVRARSGAGGAVDPRSAGVRRLAGAEAARLIAALAGEPPRLVARLLSLEAWPWAPALLDALGPAERAEVEEQLATLGPRLGQRDGDEARGAALREALVEETLRALARVPAVGARRRPWFLVWSR